MKNKRSIWNSHLLKMLFSRYLIGTSEMPFARQILFFAFFILNFHFVSSTANAQELPSYLFLEVVDSKGKPVSDATIEEMPSGKRIARTDERGQARFEFFGFKVSKQGYFLFEDLGITRTSYRTVAKIELLRMPRAKAEHKIVDNEQLKREFMLAAKHGDPAVVRRLLKSGINPNITTNDLRGTSSPKNIPAIIFAASSGDGETVRTFLSAKVNVRKKSEPINSVLAYYLRADPYWRHGTASESEKTKLLLNYEEGVRSLIKAGASLKGYDVYGTTSLMIAAQNGYAGVVQMLLDSGLSVNEKDNIGSTALMRAVQYSEHNPHFPPIKVVEVLLKAGADPNIAQNPLREYNCASVLMAATWHADLGIMRLLIKIKQM